MYHCGIRLALWIQDAILGAAKASYEVITTATERSRREVVGVG